MPKTPTSATVSPEDVGRAIRDFDSSLDLLDHAAASAFGIGRTDLRAMEIVSRSGPRTAGEIAAELGLTTGAVTALIDRMEKADYFRRSRSTSDRRQVVIELTPNAKRREQKIFGALGKESAVMLRRLSGADRAVIADFLRAIREMTERARKGIEEGA
jgi:DNA-binding MarR family transcriptional regulator